MDGSAQTITTIINSRACLVVGESLQRWARGEAIGVVTLAVVVSDSHAGGSGYWSLEARHGDSSLSRQHPNV